MTRFCMHCVTSEHLEQLYLKDVRDCPTRKYFTEPGADILPTAFLDLVDVPLQTDRIINFMMGVSNRVWHETPKKTVINSFKRVFLPWLDGYSFLETDSKSFCEELQTLM